MGNQDAPKAPAGWYPIEEGKPGERYWDGSNWSGEQRGLEPTSPEIQPVPRKINKVWFVLLGFVAVIVLFVSFGATFTSKAPFITTDKQACAEMSNAIGIVNEQNYGSVAGINSDNDKTFNIASTARAGAGIDAFEGTGNKAESPELISALSALAESWNLGSDLINYEIRHNPEYDPNYSIYRSNLKLIEVVTLCESLGYPLTNSALNFEIPEVAAPAAAPQQAAAQTSKFPAGYSDTGVGIAYMKIDGECDYARCVHYQVYAYASCPSGVYLEGNQVDANGVIYGMTNDANGGMNIGDVAVMTLRATSDSATGIKITDASCY